MPFALRILLTVWSDLVEMKFVETRIYFTETLIFTLQFTK
jgi:hypothetical protein